MDISREGAVRQVEITRGRGIADTISETQAQILAVLITLFVFSMLAYGLNILFTSLG